MNKTDKIYDYCFIISDLLSTTPRAYRAIKSLLEEGKTVYLSCNVRRFNAYDYHKELIEELEIFDFSYTEIFWKNKNLRTIFFKIIYKIIRKIHNKVSIKHKFLLSLSIDFAIRFQYYKTKNIQAKTYVGHRPASLFLISKLGKKNNSKIWFDIEDYHFEETTKPNENRMISEFIKAFSTPEIVYTNASKLIGEAYLKALGENKESVEILNSPLFEEFPKENRKNEKLSFVWFSQTVTFDRGLEYFFEALKETKIECIVHLIGSLDNKFQKYVEDLNISGFAEIIYHGFISENKINEIVFNSDIGLALELPNVDKSRNMAITNKIITYAVLGNYILASKTEGQVYFMEKIKNCGVLTNLTEIEICEQLFFIKKNLIQIRKNKEARISSSSIFFSKKENQGLPKFQ